MRVLLVTGAYPPVKCGVGDYVSHLAEGLAARADVEVGVLTSWGSYSQVRSTRVHVLSLMPGWQLRQASCFMRAVSGYKPDLIHFQYPAQGYNGRLTKWMPLLAQLLGVPVVQTWHEHYRECGAIGWPNLLACRALIYVRPNFLPRLPSWVRALIGRRSSYVPSASTIPVLSYTGEEAAKLKSELSQGKRLVCFFGFAYPNKGVERLFEIADPITDRLVLICDLNPEVSYQKMILDLASQERWRGGVTVMGFQPVQRVAEILAVADALVFPFPGGAGEWNTSLKAAQAAGAFSVATTSEVGRQGYCADENTYYAPCDGLPEMREALHQYGGTRKSPGQVNQWAEVADLHRQIYLSLGIER